MLAKNPEFYIPKIYPTQATLLDYLPKNTIILIDNAASVSVIAEEIEDQAVKMRRENIAKRLITEDFPIPYVTWSELSDQLSKFNLVDLGFPLGRENNYL